MGYGIEKYINRGKKLTIEAPRGKKRPEVHFSIRMWCGA